MKTDIMKIKVNENIRYYSLLKVEVHFGSTTYLLQYGKTYDLTQTFHEKPKKNSYRY